MTRSPSRTPMALSFSAFCNSFPLRWSSCCCNSVRFWPHTHTDRQNLQCEIKAVAAMLQTGSSIERLRSQAPLTSSLRSTKDVFFRQLEGSLILHLFLPSCKLKLALVQSSIWTNTIHIWWNNTSEKQNLSSNPTSTVRHTSENTWWITETVYKLLCNHTSENQSITSHHRSVQNWHL